MSDSIQNDQPETRRRNGFVYGPEHFDDYNKRWMKRAMTTADIRQEEYFVHSTINGPSHAEALVNEIFRNRVANGITNHISASEAVDPSDVNVVNESQSAALTAGGQAYQSRVNPVSDVRELKLSQRACSELMNLLNNQFFNMRSEEHKKVLVWFIFQSDFIYQLPEGVWDTQADPELVKMYQDYVDFNPVLSQGASPYERRWCVEFIGRSVNYFNRIRNETLKDLEFLKTILK